MSRAVWTGSVAFGLVSVDVGLYATSESKQIALNQYRRDTTDRIRYLKINERTRLEVPSDDIVKGFDVGPSEAVFLSQDELSAIDPEKSRTIEIQSFVQGSEIEPLLYRGTYFLGPRSVGSQRAYGLLRAALEKTRKVAVGSMVMKDKQYLVCIRPGPDGSMVLQTLFYQDETRDPRQEIPNLPHDQSFSRAELSLAVQLVSSLAKDWRFADYSDTHRERVQELIAAKAAGKVTVVIPAPAVPRVADLMQALEESVRVATSTKKAAPRSTAAKAAPTRKKVSA